LSSKSVLPVGTEGIVCLSLLRVAEDRVGLVYLLEALLGILIVRVNIGMMFARELAISLFDLLFARALIDAKNLVVVFIIHH
jgi:hypothetical protein